MSKTKYDAIRIAKQLQYSENTLQAIANHLTDNGFYTSRGVFHTPKSVSLLCKANGIALK